MRFSLSSVSLCAKSGHTSFHWCTRFFFFLVCNLSSMQTYK